MRKIFVKLVPFICVLAGVLFFAGGIQNGIKQKSYAEATATILNIECSVPAPDEDLQYTVFVSYDYEGKTYDGVLDSYNATMKVGDAVKVMVNPDDPTEIVTKSVATPLILCGFGVVCLLAGVILFFKQIR